MNFFIFPQINPVLLDLGVLKVHWYGVMYLIGFLSAWLLAKWRAKHLYREFDNNQISDLIFFAAIGVVVGGRLGYMIFYALPQFINKPWLVFAVWQGGMSFHGGLIGVILSLWYFAYKYKKPFLLVGDFVAPLVPIGLGAGRIGNFINGELWGRVNDVPWAMIFPHVDPFPRHPSQLYEFALEGVVLFSIIWVYSAKKRPLGNVSALFCIMYGMFRIFVEFFREPDSQLGYIAFNWLTMGQLLSLPLLIIGCYIFWKNRNANLS